MRAGLLAALLLACPLAAQQASPAEPQPYSVPNSQVHRIRAEKLGRDYDLTVLLPPSYASSQDRRYPVLFTTDAPQSILLMRGLQTRLRSGERGMEDAIIVGLGYGVGETGEYSRRRDYTPTPHGDIDARSNMPGRPVVYGEAEGYRQHLKDEVFPFLESRYRIDPARRVFAGHSYGGLFGTHVLLTDPEMFRKYILISPSLWYGRRLLIARERGYAMRHRDLPAEAFFMIGGDETVPDPDTEPFSTSRMAMVEDMDVLVRMFKSRNYPSLKVQQQVFPGEDHGSVYTPAIKAGMEWALPGSGKEPHKPCLNEQGQPAKGCRLPWQPQHRGWR